MRTIMRHVPAALAALALFPAEAAFADEATPAPAAPAGTVTDQPKPDTPLRSLMLGLRIGATVPQPFNKLDANFLGELELAYQLPFIGKRLGVFLDAGYSQPTLSATKSDARVPGGMVTYDQTIRDLGFSLGVHFWQPIASKLLVYGGAGARLHLTHTLINATSGGQPYGENTEDSTRVGAMVRLGAGYVLGPGALVLEIHFEWTGIDHLITGGERSGESANTSNLAFQLGYQFFLL